MNRKKLNIIMFSLTFILLCLIVFCLVYMDEIKDRIDDMAAPETVSSEYSWDTEPSTEDNRVPTYTLGTVPETTEATEATTEPTVETTEETTAPTTEPETEPPTTVPETDPDIGESAAEIARQQLGKPYQYGGQGPDNFDTSGLIYYCYQQIGVSVPRNTGTLAKFGYEVDKKDIRPGDVVFFWSKEAGNPEYLGIYVGDGIVIAALNSSKPVVQFNMNSAYYTEHFVFVRRLY